MKNLIFIICFVTSALIYAQNPVQVPKTTQSTPQKPKTGCIEGDCQNGWGKYQYDNGYYSGFFTNGKRDGYGMYQWTEQGKYIGFWKNGVRDGYGVYFYQNGKDEISGMFADGELNGFGKMYKEEKWSQGVFENGSLKTPHTFYTNNKELGCVAGDCQDKYGRYKWENGDQFTGFFKNGNMYMGTYKFTNGDKYSGVFDENNRFNGPGRFFFVDGSYYGGEWKNGTYNGRGYYVDKNKLGKKGIWQEGNLIETY